MKITLIRWICTQTRFSIRRLFFLTEAVSIVCGSAVWFFVIQKMYRIGGESGNLCGGLWYSGVKVWSYRFDSTMWRTVKRTQFGFYRRTLCKLMKNNKFAYRKLQISLGFSSRKEVIIELRRLGRTAAKHHIHHYKQHSSLFRYLQ